MKLWTEKGDTVVCYEVNKVEFKYNENGALVVLHLDCGITITLDDEICEAIGVEL